jgi:hypothetical protein
MWNNVFQLVKPLKVIQLGPERETQLEELPSGAEVQILRESRIGDCVDIAYENERYFALKNDMLRGSEQRLIEQFHEDSVRRYGTDSEQARALSRLTVGR